MLLYAQLKLTSFNDIVSSTGHCGTRQRTRSGRGYP